MQPLVNWIDQNRRDAALAGIFGLLFAYLAITYAITLFADGGEPWLTGDWLVNYAGGFVRRGGFGALVRLLDGAGLPAKWLLYVSQTGIYAVIFVIVLRIGLGRKLQKEWLLLLLSPAFVLFPFYDFLGGFRKETLGFLVGALIALAAVRARRANLSITLAAALYVLAVLSHTINALLLPYLLFFLHFCSRNGAISRRGYYLWVAAFSATSLIGIALALSFPAGPETSDTVCASVISMGFAPGICDGAILWLQLDFAFIWEILSRLYPDNLISYGLYALIAAAPVVLIRLPNKWPLTILFFIVIAPLYLIAIDWGRILHISVFFLTLALLTMSWHEDISFRPVPWLAIILYLSLWSMPHCCKGFDFGLAGKLYGFVAPVTG